MGRILSRFSRVTSSGKWLAEIDGLRFIAIISVVLTHIMSDTVTRVLAVSELDRALVTLLHKGEVGVQIFFAISGFILALPFVEACFQGACAPRLGEYYRRRVYRIEPPYVISMVVLTAIALLAGGLDRIDRLPHLLASLFYVHNVVYDAWSGINFVAWSLEVEVQFYLIAPLLATVFALHSRSLRITLIVAGMIACGLAATWVEPMSFRVRTMLPFQLQYFLAGFLLAEVFVNDWRGKPTKAWYWTVIAVLGWVGVFLVGDWPSFQSVLACLIFVAFFASMRSSAVSSFLANRWISTIGGMCYSIYLWHFWFYAAYARPTAFEGGFARVLLINCLLGIPVVLVGSAVFFLLFEKTFMRRDWPSAMRKKFDRIVAWREYRLSSRA